MAAKKRPDYYDKYNHKQYLACDPRQLDTLTLSATQLEMLQLLREAACQGGADRDWLLAFLRYWRGQQRFPFQPTDEGCIEPDQQDDYDHYLAVIRDLTPAGPGGRAMRHLLDEIGDPVATLTAAIDCLEEMPAAVDSTDSEVDAKQPLEMQPEEDAERPDGPLAAPGFRVNGVDDQLTSQPWRLLNALWAAKDWTLQKTVAIRAVHGEGDTGGNTPLHGERRAINRFFHKHKSSYYVTIPPRLDVIKLVKGKRFKQPRRGKRKTK